jgi:hypothetical protein
LEARGVEFTLDGATLWTRPAGILDDDDRVNIRAYKFALVALLKFREAVAARTIADESAALVWCDSELSALWHAAEISTGQRLRVDGAPLDEPSRELERMAA